MDPYFTEEMPFPENDPQMASQGVTHETAPPDITLEIVSPKLYTAQPISENASHNYFFFKSNMYNMFVYVKFTV
jgi:hypothetical protein